MTRILSGALVALTLAATLLTASAPASSAAPHAPQTLRSVASDASLLVPGESADDSADSQAAWGKAGAKRQTLRSGCRAYTFRYRVTAPGDNWMAEISLISPDGDALAARSFKAFAGDPRAAKRRFRVCDVSTRPGRHTITMKVTAEVDQEDRTQRSAPARFRLTRR